MIASGPIVVHVLNSGTDWLSLAAVISTGLVGVLGASAAIWQAVHGWKREDNRAKLAERRRVYGNYVAALSEALFTIFKDAERTAEQREQGRGDFYAAEARAVTRLYEVHLIAPDDVANKATVALNALNQTSFVDPAAYLAAVRDLKAAMRSNLGEGPMTEAEEPIILV